MSLKLVRNAGVPRRFSAPAGSRPTIMVRGRRGPVVLQSATLRGVTVAPQTPNTITIDVAAGVNTLRLLLDPYLPDEMVEVCESSGDAVQVLDSYAFNPWDPVSGYRIVGE